MTTLISHFMNDHRTILTLLKYIKTGDLTVQEKEAYLLTIRSVLKQHLEAEDTKLYPGLKKLATPDNGAANTVKEFTAGLDRIGKIINEFFDNNEKDLNGIQRDPDFAKIIKLLEIRIVKEEKELYPLYEKLYCC